MTADWTADVLTQVAAVEQGHREQGAGTWRCPGCGLPYDEIPVGHAWTYGAGGSCSDPTPVSPADFLPRRCESEACDEHDGVHCYGDGCALARRVGR